MSEEAFDPTAPEGDPSSGSQYVTRKDVKIIGVLLVVMVLILTPIYRYMKANSERSICAANLSQVFKAMGQYAEQHDDRIPPIFRMDDHFSPALNTQGRPYTWLSDLYEFIPRRFSFVCPSALLEEKAVQEHPDSSKLSLESSYGLYVGYSSSSRSSIEIPGSTFLLGETSNHGSKGSSNPTPYAGPEGSTVPYDGFAIGWSDSNRKPSGSSQSVTRLAFPGTDKGVFSDLGESRHGSGIYCLTADGKRMLVKPDVAKLRIVDDLPSGFWRVPVTVTRNK